MQMFMEIMNSNLVAALFSAIISLIGVIISLKYSTNEMTKKTNQALKLYESNLDRKVYVSSKRADLEFQIFQKLSICCGDVLHQMQRLYPDKISTHEINYAEKVTLNDLALKIRSLELEINMNKIFVPNEIIISYTKLLDNAETFFVDAEKHKLCWDDSKEDRARKCELRDKVYKTRKLYEKNWEITNLLVKQYLLSKETF